MGGTSDPVWNEEFNVGLYVSGAPIVFEVKDDDPLGDDDLGTATLASQLFSPNGTETTIGLTGNVGSEPSLLRVRVTVLPDFDCTVGTFVSWSMRKRELCCKQFRFIGDDAYACPEDTPLGS